MARLKLSLLGRFHATLDGSPPADLRSGKSRALLAYLAGEAGHPHQRTALSTMLWGEHPDEDALADRRAAGEQTHALENLAGLAEIALSAGNLAQAQSHVEEILTHLATAPVDGAEEPLRIYLTCYRVLRDNSDPRAYGILSAARDLLAQRAAEISDPALRQSYLEKVAVHRALAAAGA